MQSKSAKEVKREIQKVLVASTAHVDEEDIHLIKNYEGKIPLIVNNYKEGTFIMLTDSTYESIDEIAASFSQGLVKLIHLAKELECEILRLDEDGPIYKDLIVNKW